MEPMRSLSDFLCTRIPALQCSLRAKVEAGHLVSCLTMGLSKGDKNQISSCEQFEASEDCSMVDDVLGELSPMSLGL